MALVAVTVLFLVRISTMSAVMAVPEATATPGRVFGASPWPMFRHVLLPMSLPTVLVGARITAGVAVLS